MKFPLSKQPASRSIVVVVVVVVMDPRRSQVLPVEGHVRTRRSRFRVHHPVFRRDGRHRRVSRRSGSPSRGRRILRVHRRTRVGALERSRRSRRRRDDHQRKRGHPNRLRLRDARERQVRPLPGPHPAGGRRGGKGAVQGHPGIQHERGRSHRPVGHSGIHHDGGQVRTKRGIRRHPLADRPGLLRTRHLPAHPAEARLGIRLRDQPVHHPHRQGGSPRKAGHAVLEVDAEHLPDPSGPRPGRGELRKIPDRRPDGNAPAAVSPKVQTHEHQERHRGHPRGKAAPARRRELPGGMEEGGGRRRSQHLPVPEGSELLRLGRREDGSIGVVGFRMSTATSLRSEQPNP
mmetsp:Transcript_1051/g.2395  ORF Transcript_1051/g.2395 Transcript_1051/m.2395 type:complete len:346 (-) Transcript_1051:83-1120(-)